MTKPLTIEIDENAARRLDEIARDLGETPEAFAARVLVEGLDSFETSVLMTRRAKGIDREQAIAWLSDMKRKSGKAPDADDRPPR